MSRPRTEAHRIVDELEDRLRRRRGELEDDGAKTELEERGVDWPLERDDPRAGELTHGEATPDLLAPPELER